MRSRRHPLDQYETAPWQVDALVDHLPELSGTIWCPTVGDGALARQLLLRRPDLTLAMTNDISPAVRATHHDDATHADSWLRWIGIHGKPDWVIDNFPFNVEFEVIRHAYVAARCGVVAMARLSFVEGTQARGRWLAAHPRRLQIVLERYSFTGNGKSDTATTEWLVWSRSSLINCGGFTAYGYKHEEKAGSR